MINEKKKIIINKKRKKKSIHWQITIYKFKKKKRKKKIRKIKEERRNCHGHNKINENKKIIKHKKRKKTGIHWQIPIYMFKKKKEAKKKKERNKVKQLTKAGINSIIHPPTPL